MIVASNYWQSEMAERGLLYLSINAGAFRLLVPQCQRRIISDMRPGAKHIVISMLLAQRWAMALAEDSSTTVDHRARQTPGYVLEWMVEDGTDHPWSCHLSAGQVDRAPTVPDVGQQWLASVWDWKKNKPHKCLERPAYLNVVPTLPWLRKIG